MAEETKIVVGMRVVIKGNQPLGPGTVRYVGLAKFQTGRWIGIELDAKLGKNDGEVQGERYFECFPGHGIFYKPPQVIPISADGIPLESYQEVDSPTTVKLHTSEPPTLPVSPSTHTLVSSVSSKSLAINKDKLLTDPTKKVVPKTTTAATKTTTTKTKPLSLTKTASSKVIITATKPKTSVLGAKTATTSKTGAVVTKTALKGSPTSSLTKALSHPPSTEKTTTSHLSAIVSAPQLGSEQNKKDVGGDSDEKNDKPQNEDKQQHDNDNDNGSGGGGGDDNGDDDGGELLAGDYDDSGSDGGSDGDGDGDGGDDENQRVVDDDVAEESPVKSTTITPSPRAERPPATTYPIDVSSFKSDSVDRMMQALKELNDFKVKAQETIQKLQQNVNEMTTQREKLVKEHEKEVQKMTQEYEKDIKQQTKQDNRTTHDSTPPLKSSLTKLGIREFKFFKVSQQICLHPLLHESLFFALPSEL